LARVLYHVSVEYIDMIKQQWR